MPAFEKTELFSRAVGEETDIVNKEMYSFEDRNGDSLALRPEGTAQIVRSILENNLLSKSPILRLWYYGRFFRYERPQKGRLREFRQYGAECVGSPEPLADAEIISLAAEIAKAAGLDNFTLYINSLGDLESRLRYKKALIEYLKASENELSADSRRRLERNPLRILDSKDPNDALIIQEAPKILDYLNKESSSRFENVLKILKDLNVESEIEPKLVRGLDYYSHTVFEFQSKALGAQNAFGGGGRYDGLFEQLGSKKKIPAVGFAFGVDRMALALEAEGKSFEEKPLDYYVVAADEEGRKLAPKIARALRKEGFSASLDLLNRSFKAQMREANKSRALSAIIIGSKEIEKGSAILKDMDDGSQKNIPLSGFDL